MKFDRILFPVDFSDSGLKLNPQVEWLSQKFNSRVTLLHVFEIPSSWYGGADAPMLSGEDIVAFANDEKGRLQNYSIHIPESRLDRISLEGGAAWHIGNWAKDHATDLIVMGTHGFGAFRRMLLGSVAMKVLHDVDCPVWMQAPGAAHQPPFSNVNRILCPIELTDEAKPLLRFANDLARSFGAEVHLLHVIPEEAVREYRYFDVDFHNRLVQMARDQISKLQQEAGTAFPLTITKGLICEDAAELALNSNSDLMLIGRGKTRGVLGSLRSHAPDLIRMAPCPVLSYSADWLARQFRPAVATEAATQQAHGLTLQPV